MSLGRGTSLDAGRTITRVPFQPIAISAAGKSAAARRLLKQLNDTLG